MTSRCGWRVQSTPIQIRASPCSIHGTAMGDYESSATNLFLLVEQSVVEVFALRGGESRFRISVN